jgi:prepilin-type N-terminal cleavage/methylation domain-containing protein
LRITLSYRFLRRKEESKVFRQKYGFTLVELMIVIALVAILAGLAIPALLRARLSSQETGAVTLLRSLVANQESFRSALVNDTNMNGTGEYGFLQELAGVVPPRDANSSQREPGEFLQQSYGRLNAFGEAAHRGYNFKLYILESVRPIDFAEEVQGAVPPIVGMGADLAETAWVCFAWPSNWGKSGKRAFCATNDGLIYATANDAGAAVTYGSAGGGPLPSAPFEPVRFAADNLAFPNPGLPSNDGNIWIPI